MFGPFPTGRILWWRAVKVTICLRHRRHPQQDRSRLYSATIASSLSHYLNAAGGVLNVSIAQTALMSRPALWRQCRIPGLPPRERNPSSTHRCLGAAEKSFHPWSDDQTTLSIVIAPMWLAVLAGPTGWAFATLSTESPVLAIVCFLLLGNLLFTCLFYLNQER